MYVLAPNEDGPMLLYRSTIAKKVWTRFWYHCQVATTVSHSPVNDVFNIFAFQAYVSAKRIASMLLLDEIDPDAIEKDPNVCEYFGSYQLEQTDQT